MEFSSSEELADSGGYYGQKLDMSSDGDDDIQGQVSSKFGASNPYSKYAGAGSNIAKVTGAGAGSGYGSYSGYSAGNPSYNYGKGMSASSYGGGYGNNVGSGYGNAAGSGYGNAAGSGYATYSGNFGTGSAYSSGYSGGYNTGGFGAGSGYGSGYGGSFDSYGGANNDPYGYEIDLKDIQKRKETQKNSKIAASTATTSGVPKNPSSNIQAENKKPLTTSAPAASKATTSSFGINANNKISAEKKTGKVSFDFSEALALKEEENSSDNDNNKTISHISDDNQDNQYLKKDKDYNKKNNTSITMTQSVTVQKKIETNQDKDKKNSNTNQSDFAKLYEQYKNTLEDSDKKIKESVSNLDKNSNRSSQISDEKSQKSEESENYSYGDIELPKPTIYDVNATNKLAESQSLEESSKKVEVFTKKDTEPIKRNEKTPSKERDHDSSYPSDFEQSLSPSSKFASTDQLEASKGQETKLASALAKKVSVDQTGKQDIIPATTNLVANNPLSTYEVIKPQLVPEYKPSSIGNITYNTSDKAEVKDYVYEAMLKEEKRKVQTLEVKLNQESSSLEIVQKALQEKDLAVMKAEAKSELLTKELNTIKDSFKEANQRNAAYQVEIESLIKQLDITENKMKEFEDEKKILQQENDEKMRIIRERREFQEKSIETRLVSELKKQAELDKELLQVQVEALRNDIEYYQNQITKFETEVQVYKASLKSRVNTDEEVRKLKQEILDLEIKLKEREEGKNMGNRRGSPARNKEPSSIKEIDHENNIEGIMLNGLDKEFQMQELLLKGFQKENEKLVIENKALKKEVETLKERLYDDNKKFSAIKAHMAKDIGNYLLTDKEVDIETKNLIGGDNLISKNELKEAQNKILKLQDDLKLSESRTLELQIEIDRLRAKKSEIEAKSAKVDMRDIQNSNVAYKELEKNLADTTIKYENDIKDLKSKLGWYIENQATLSQKDAEIQEKDEALKKAQEEIQKLFKDPQAITDGKVKLLMRQQTEDQKRIKQLNDQVTQLTDALAKRNPGAYKELKNEQEESQKVKDLKSQVKKLEEQYKKRETDYETSLTDLKQNYDKIVHGYQKRIAELQEAGTKPEKFPKSKSKNLASGSEDSESVEVLKQVIKDLQKEIQSLKEYALKKAPKVKLVPRKPPIDNSKKPDINLVKVRKPSADLNNNSQDNAVDSTNPDGLSAQEKSNMINSLLNLDKEKLSSLLSNFKTFKANLLCAIEIKGETLKPVVDFINVLDKMNKEIRILDELIDALKSTKSEIEQKLEDDESLKDLINEIEDSLITMILTEIKKDKGAFLMNKSKQEKVLVNNFVDNSEIMAANKQAQEYLKELEQYKKIIIAKENEYSDLKEKTEKCLKENSLLKHEKATLEEIIKKMPKNPTSLEFATLEKKLEIMEKNQRENELELRNAFKKLFNKDPFSAGGDNQEVMLLKMHYENQIQHLRKVLDVKNAENTHFRKELSVILTELERLKKMRN